tara:strand:- start:531 stop:794 length:264 start_codon:yes stop_codon:yes gene_type:complete
MEFEKEVAQLMFTLARSKGNWGNKYDRLEHFKKFSNLKQIIREYSKKEWILIKNKPNYTGISLNTKFKKEIFEFIEEQLPYTKNMIK